MQAIADNVYIEDQYPGVTLGAICLPRGLVYIDAPPSPEDGRSWRAELLDLSLSCGHERLLVNLDTATDRTLGGRAMDCIVLAHEKTAQLFSSRSSIFKTQGRETGAEWETIPALGSIRWAPPEISFSQQITLHWGRSPVVFEHHPGSDDGAIWVVLPDEKIVFVGDTVMKNQPPSLSNADLPLWIETLKILLSDKYRGYTIVSGRGGKCATSTIRKQLDYIKQIHKKLERLASRKASPEATERLIQPLLSPLRFLASNRERYAQRLRYGLHAYYIRHYQLANTEDKA